MLSTKLFTIFLLVAVFEKASAAVCPDVTGVADYDNSRVLGTWFLYAAYENDLTSGDCATFQFDDAGDGVTTNFNVSKILDGANVDILGSYVLDSEILARLYVTSDIGDFTATCIGTDYSNYLFTYSCTENEDSTISEIVWINTREKFAGPHVRKLINEIIEENEFGVIDPTFLIGANQNC